MDATHPPAVSPQQTVPVARRDVLAFFLRDGEVGDLFGVVGTDDLVEYLAHVRRFRPEHVIQALALLRPGAASIRLTAAVMIPLIPPQVRQTAANASGTIRNVEDQRSL